MQDSSGWETVARKRPSKSMKHKHSPSETELLGVTNAVLQSLGFDDDAGGLDGSSRLPSRGSLLSSSPEEERPPAAGCAERARARTPTRRGPEGVGCRYRPASAR